MTTVQSHSDNQWICLSLRGSAPLTGLEISGMTTCSRATCTVLLRIRSFSSSVAFASQLNGKEAYGQLRFLPITPLGKISSALSPVSSDQVTSRRPYSELDRE